MNAEQLDAYIRARIPLFTAMQARVETASPREVVLAAPLAPNINHSGTVFGGSAATLATLAAWALVNVGLAAEQLQAQVVVRRSGIEYPQPLRGEFRARCTPQAAAWTRFCEVLRQRGRARLTLTAEVSDAGGVGAVLDGEFVAILP